MDILQLPNKKTRETHLWEVDPSLFQPIPKAGFVERRVLIPFKSLAKYALYMLAFAYPIILVTVGIVFGGLVFWSSFGGSAGLIYLILKKTGYARNFASWDVGYRKFVGLVGGFVMMLGLFYGLLYTPFHLFSIPLVGGILALVLFVGVWKVAKR